MVTLLRRSGELIQLIPANGEREGGVVESESILQWDKNQDKRRKMRKDEVGATLYRPNIVGLKSYLTMI